MRLCFILCACFILFKKFKKNNFVSCGVVSWCVVSYGVVLCRVIWCRVVSYGGVSYQLDSLFVPLALNSRIAFDWKI